MRDAPRPAALRVIAVLRAGDHSIQGGLAAHHCVVVGAPADTLERTVGIERANAVVVDVEVSGVFEAIQRLRKVLGAAGSVPVALVGPPELSVLAADFLQRHGPGFFAARPINVAEVASRLRALHDADPQQRRGVSSSNPVVSSLKNTPVPGPSVRSPAMQGPRGKSTPLPFQPHSVMRAPTPMHGSMAPVPMSISPSSPTHVPGPAYATVPPGMQGVPEGPLPHAASPALRPGTIAPAVLNPPSLSAPLTSLLRSALQDAGGDAAAFELPSDASDELDDLVPPELLEPLDAPFDALVEEGTDSGRFATSSTTSPGVSSRRGVRSTGHAAGVTPLPIEGDLRLGGSLGRYGVPTLLSAALRVRATGVIFARSRGAQWQIALHAGHVLAVRGSRPEDLIGPLLARLGYIPQEAARFAEVPLDLGVRGAALLAARGYVASDGLAPLLARAAQELLFDLFCIDTIEWEVRALENSVGIPMQTRAPDVLLVQGARARIEPSVAYAALGGDGTNVTLRAEPAAIASLPLSASERTAALAARDVSLAAILRTHGELVLPALLALHWLQHLRVEGPAHDINAAGTPGPERTRLRALVEAARRRDFMAILGVSPFATRGAAQMALDARRAEIDAIRARSPTAESLPLVTTSLDDIARMLGDTSAWERFVSALRASALRDE